MLQSTSRHGISLTQDPGVRIVIDGRLHGGGELASWVPDFIEDAADATWDFAKEAANKIADLPGVAYNAGKWLAHQVCDVALDEDVIKYVGYLRESILVLAIAALVPGPQQAATVTTLAATKATLLAYEKAAAICGLVLPPAPPPVPGPNPPTGPGATNPGKLPVARSLLLKSVALTTPAAAPKLAPRSLVQTFVPEKPWYKRGSTYAAAGGVAAAIGAAYYFARVR